MRGLRQWEPDERLSKWTRKTLNRPPPTRAKSAPVQARIVRFQAVNSGFAAPHSRSYQPAESRSTVRKTAQESQESGRWQKARLFGRWDFKTTAFNRSATPPGATLQG
jgi:hypothetical protein